MESDDTEFSKQLLREKLRHERAAYVAGDGLEDRGGAWVPPEKWIGPPWIRSRASFHHEYSAVPRFAGGRVDGPVAKKFRGDWTDFPLSMGPPRGPHLMPNRGPWQSHHHRPDFNHYLSHYPSASSAKSAPSSSSSSSSQPPTSTVFSSTLPDAPSSALTLFPQSPLDRIKDEALRKSLGEFFMQHKDEEWFKHKYHPLEFSRRIAERKEMVRSRKLVFEKLMKLDLLDKVNLEVDRVKDIVKILDAAVILMEGGLEHDLKILGQEEDIAGSHCQEIKEQNAKVTPAMPAKFTEPLKLAGNSLEKSSAEPLEMGDDANISDSGSISDSDDEPRINKSPGAAHLLTPSSETKNSGGPSGDDEMAEQKPKPLHKTVSLFLRNLPTSITKDEIEEFCRSYPGFLRVAVQDPQPENKFLRRAWVTFESWVNVKDVCWNMSSLKIRDYDLKPTVNSELKQRVRTVGGLVCHKVVAKQDIKHIVKVIQNLDSIHGVWDDGDDDDDDGNSGCDGDRSSDKREVFGFVSKNPLLKNITDFLVDEGSYEEEALLDKSGSCWDDYDDRPKPAHAEVFIEKDNALLKALDRMIIYLRIVHSLDYYVAADYQDEDSMPHKCGIIHVRASKPTHKVTQNDVDEWMTSFGSKISEFSVGRFWLSDEEISRYGKNKEAEVEKFIAGNTQELSKDKWLCPLSGKKFKGPDFVKKHIKTKHADKLDLVKTEVEYFNNYLRDARRPHGTVGRTTLGLNSQHVPLQSAQSSQNSISSPSTYTTRFIHHYSPIRRPVHRPSIVYRPSYGDGRIPGDIYQRPREFIPRRGRFSRPFVTRPGDPSS